MKHHQNNIQNNTFINPYNFVPVDFSVPEKEKITAQGGNLTGVIECSLYTKTPLAILDTGNVDVWKFQNVYTEQRNNEEKKIEKTVKHKIYDFMKTKENQYMIPGSALRGAIRNIHEVVAEDACFSTIKKETYITNRSSGAFSPAILKREENGDWKLYDAERYMLKCKNYKSKKGGKEDFRQTKNELVWKAPTYFVNCDKEGRKYVKDRYENVFYSGERVWMNVLSSGGKPIRYKKQNIPEEAMPMVVFSIEKYKKEKGLKEYYLVLGETFGNKHHESVFEIKENQLAVKEINENPEFIKSALKRLDETYKVHNDEKVNRNATNGRIWYSDYKELKKGSILPIWYNYENGILYFSFAQMAKFTYERNLISLFDKKAACDSNKHLCETCSLFGMVNGDAYGSRIRFTDAVSQSGDIHTKYLTLNELSSPKPSYVPFYLKKKQDGTARGAIGYDNEGYELSGRKFYWHFKNQNLFYKTKEKFEREKAEIERGDKNYSYLNRNATVEVIGCDDITEKFQFKVYFENLSEDELEKLVYSINLGQNKPDAALCHKLGHGKPLGLGSVKIVVDDIVQRTFDIANGYEEESIKDTYVKSDYEFKYTKSDLKKERIVALENITNFYLLGTEQKVQYPKLSKEFNWFAKNYKKGSDEPQQTLQNLGEKAFEKQDVRALR